MKRLEKEDVANLKKNDLVLIKYGFDHIKVRVVFVSFDSIYGHSIKWMKSSSKVFVYDDIKNDGVFYVGRMSKFRSFFML